MFMTNNSFHKIGRILINIKQRLFYSHLCTHNVFNMHKKSLLHALNTTFHYQIIISVVIYRVKVGLLTGCDVISCQEIWARLAENKERY